MSECFLYLIASSIPLPANVSADATICKIGISADPTGRLASLRTASPFSLEINAEWYFPNREMAMFMERAAHKALDRYRVRGEWFAVDLSLASYVITDCWCIESVERGILTPAKLVDDLISRGYGADYATDAVISNYGEDSLQ
jgi:hypothetical protein